MELISRSLILFFLTIISVTNGNATSTLQPIFMLLLNSSERSNVNEYEEVVSPYTNRVWLDRNLGAKQVCNRLDDEDCYGHYFQWGRNADGHELKTSATTQTLSSTAIPGHSLFILTMELEASNNAERRNWLFIQDDTLWSNNINNPCPTGYRLPTEIEFMAEMTGGNVNNYIDTFNSFLKMPVAGIRGDWYDFSNVYGDGSYSYYWTSSLSSDAGGLDPVMIYSNSSSLYKVLMHASTGASVRCIKN